MPDSKQTSDPGSPPALDSAGRLALADALSIVRQVSEALDYAREMAVIHRDIKPSNLFINDRGD